MAHGAKIQIFKQDPLMFQFSDNFITKFYNRCLNNITEEENNEISFIFEVVRPEGVEPPTLRSEV